jgi:uncharacterized membrane protein
VPDEETRRTERATERLTIFSDAVVAIAMTLLAIDLPVPEGDTVSAFWTSFQHNDGHYASFLISFAVIAGAWTDHHDLFRYVTGTDARTRTYNMGWLLTIVLVPFATRMLIVSGQSLGTHALRFGFYALLQLLEAAALYAMLRHLVSRGLIDASPQTIKRIGRTSVNMMIGYGLSIPVFFVTAYAWVLWIITPLLAGRLRRLRHPDSTPGTARDT